MLELLVKKKYFGYGGTPPPFAKPFGLTSGTSMRGTVGLILVRKIFNCFNFNSIDLYLT